MIENVSCVVPLFPFSSDVAEINLLWGIKITPASDLFKKSMRAWFQHANSFWHDNDRIENLWTAQIPYIDKHIDELDFTSLDGQSLPDLLANAFAIHTGLLAYVVVTALRLYKEGLVTPGPIAMPLLPSDGLSWLTPDWLNITEDDFVFDEPINYRLLGSDSSEINAILMHIYKWMVSKKNENINTALHRFHSSYTGIPEQRIIDQIIAFEAIFLGDQPELTYKLSLRTSFFVSRDRQERKVVFKDMHNAYSQRSKIVHAVGRADIDSLKALLPKTENYLRYSIRQVLKLISEGHNISQNWFDNYILNS